MPRNELRNRDVKSCPVCKGDLTPQPSRNRLAVDSTRYQCESCKLVFEINDITKAAGRFPEGQGARKTPDADLTLPPE